MASMFDTYKKFDRKIEEALRDDLSAEKLKTIEEEVTKLAAVTAPLPNPRLADLGQLAEAVERALTGIDALSGRREIFICELPSVDGRTPDMEDLKADPELSRLVTFIDNLGHCNLKIRTTAMLRGVTLRAGAIFEQVEASAACPKRNCLVLGPGR